MIGGVLLAAGGARRFGSQKLVAPFMGAPLVRHAAATLTGLVDEAVVVLGHESALVREALRDLQLRIAVNAEWGTGLASSIRCGVASLPDDVEGVLVALGDQPGLDGDAGRAVLACWRETGSPIVVPEYADGRGHPVFFAREIFGELLALAGDRGARSVIERDPARVSAVTLAANAPPDVDTAEDLDRVASALFPARPT